MSIEVLSLLGIILALIIIIGGSMKNVSLIILSSVAAFIVAWFSGVGVLKGYSTYIGGVGNSVISLFPIFLGGQLLGSALEKTGLTESIAIALFKKVGEKSIIFAVFAISWILLFSGVNVFVIIFTVYPLAAAFFKLADIPRALIPACVLGAAVSMQCLPGTATTANILPTEAFGVPASAGSMIGIVCSGFLFVANCWYLINEAKKYKKSGVHFVPKAGEDFQINLDKAGLPNPFLGIIPIGVVLILLNGFHIAAYASLYVGAVVCVLMFWKRIGGVNNVLKTLDKAARSSQSVVSTAAIVGFGTIVTAVPGYEIIQKGLIGASSGNPYIFAFLCVAVIAGVSGSATGGIKFVLNAFADKLIAMGGNPAALSRVITVSSLTFDSLPHNSAIVLTLDYCGVTHKEGYKHLAVTTVLNTTIAAFIAIVMANMGIY
jgi:H+/gluconate symporter-like permease